MDATTYTQARQNLKAIFDKATQDSVPTIVQRRGGDDVVIISRTDYEALDETAYLLRSPANRKHLLEGIKEIKKGNTIEFDPTEL